YMRPNDSLRLADGRLTRINYKFWRGKLHGVVLEVSPGSLKQVMEAMRVVYGKPSQPNPLKSKFCWMSLGAGEESTRAMIDADVTRQSGTAIIFSRVLIDRRN